MKSAPACIATMLAAVDVAQRLEIAGGENRLQMRRAAGFAHRPDFVVERAPFAVEDVGAGDDDVDLVRALADRVVDFGEAQLQRRQAGGKAGRDRGDGNAGAGERLDGGRDHRGIDADRADGRRRSARPSASSKSSSSGRRALAQSRRTRPGVSSPESVVRSMQVSALTSQAAWYPS